MPAEYGWTVNNMLKGDTEPGHFPEDVPNIVNCAYCGEDVIEGEPCTCEHYWPDAPDVDDSVKCCPDCERPNQFGETCVSCRRDAELAETDEEASF